MNTLEQLLSKRWILKERHKELYYQIRDEASNVKKFATEKLGYSIITNPYLIKMEKVPAKPEAWMGITEFDSKIEYGFLCMVLMFLEDKDAKEQFILSQLTEYIQVQYKYETIDWTQYNYRRRLIKVMKFCLANGMIMINDGSEDAFKFDQEGDVLYENTGASRYFMRNFTKDITQYTTPEDFEKEDWIGMDEDRGIIRRQRVYRNLVMNSAFYHTDENEEDFDYIRKYRNIIREDLGKLFECELHIHKSGAYLVLGENCNMGKTFPAENAMPDIILLCNQILRKRIEEGQIIVPADEMILLERMELESIIEECKETYQSGFPKGYREKTLKEFITEVIAYLELMEWIRIDSTTGVVTLYPIMGKLKGKYPNDFSLEVKKQNE